jgi:hypothetical protein
VIFKSRRIFKTATTSQNEIRELLQFIFVGELLDPGKEIWLVTPWISNVPVLDNRSGLFNMLEPSWGSRQIRINEILVRLLSLGSNIIIVTRPDDHCRQCIARLKEQAEDFGVEKGLHIIWKKELHIKGFLTDTNLITGSMNLTNNGLDILDEQVTFDTDRQDIALARLKFNEYLEGDERT